MCNIQEMNNHWIYQVKVIGFPVTLPHTYNALDGQDGGNDYYQGKVLYTRHLTNPARDDGEHVYLEFKGVNSSTVVLIYGFPVAIYKGDYSIFYTHITPYLEAENLIEVEVDNSIDPFVYP